MEPFLGLLLAGAGGSVAYLALKWWSRERGRLWREAADAAHLTNIDVTTFLGWTSKLVGKSGPLTVTIGTYHRGKDEHGTRVTVGGFHHGTYGLTIRAEGLTSSIEKTFGERELEVGDPEFDEAAYLQGGPALVRAIFDRETRRMVGTLLRGKMRVGGREGQTEFKVRTSLSDDELRVDVRARLLENVDRWLPAALPTLVDIGRRLRRPDDLAAKIVANTRAEKLPAVRLGSLQTLTTEFPRHPGTREALLAALDDPSLEIRLHAAIALGPEGRATLQTLAADDGADTVSARAISALGSDFALERAIERLRQSRAKELTATALACIEAIGRAGTPEGSEALADMLATAPDHLAVAAAGAIAGEENEKVERGLLAALERESAEVRVAAAEALGRVGSPSAVVPLREASGAHTFDGALRRATRQAIAEIQSRVTGASPGQLSLAAEEAGQVSLVDEDRRGQVSLEGGTEAAPPSGSVLDSVSPAKPGT